MKIMPTYLNYFTQHNEVKAVLVKAVLVKAVLVKAFLHHYWEIYSGYVTFL